MVSGVRRMNEVNARRARLVLGWVTVFGRVHHLGMQPANYTVSQKTRHLTLAHNFTKYWPIFKILLLLDSVGNL